MSTRMFSCGQNMWSKLAALGQCQRAVYSCKYCFLNIVNDGLVCPAIDGVNCPDSADETVQNKILRKGELRQLSLNNPSDHMIIDNPVSVA
jgi:hypothetical protein